MNTRRTKPTVTPELEPARSVSPIDAFRRGGLYELPHSLLTVRLRWPRLYALAARGAVPNGLSAAVMRLIIAERVANGEDAPTPTREEREQHYREHAQGYLELAALTLAEPRMVLDREPNEGAGEIGPDDLPDHDIRWIVEVFVQEGPAEFRVG
jgi:hypothetical protein